MDAREKHALKEFDRRLGVPNAGFIGPVGETGSLDTIAQRDDAVLVPGQGPVVGFGFVEGDNADGTRVRKQLAS
jgi:hypothetical protein